MHTCQMAHVVAVIRQNRVRTASGVHGPARDVGDVVGDVVRDVVGDVVGDVSVVCRPV